MALPSSKNISTLFCDSLQLFFSGIIIIEAEHGYASSLPMPIEDDGSSPTPSSSSSSTRPIKIKKNQGSRWVFFCGCCFGSSECTPPDSLFLFFCPTGRHTTSWRRTGENRKTRKRRQQQRLPSSFFSHVTRWRQPIGDDSGKPLYSPPPSSFFLGFGSRVDVPSVRDPCHTRCHRVRSKFIAPDDPR